MTGAGSTPLIENLVRDAVLGSKAERAAQGVDVRSLDIVSILTGGNGEFHAIGRREDAMSLAELPSDIIGPE